MKKQRQAIRRVSFPATLSVDLASIAKVFGNFHRELRETSIKVPPSLRLPDWVIPSQARAEHQWALWGPESGQWQASKPAVSPSFWLLCSRLVPKTMQFRCVSILRLYIFRFQLKKGYEPGQVLPLTRTIPTVLPIVLLNRLVLSMVGKPGNPVCFVKMFFT